MTVSPNASFLLSSAATPDTPSARLVMMVPVPATVQQRLESIGWECTTPVDRADAEAQLASADACVGKLDPILLAAAPRLRWLQATSAALDKFWFPELRASSITVTNLRGIYSDFIADHVMGFILSFARGLHHYNRFQAAGRWEPSAPVHYLAGATLLIIGFGGIGTEVAKRAQVFGLKVVAVDPQPRGTPESTIPLFPPARLAEVLPHADFIVLTAPHTSETEFMINERTLACMKPTAFLINVGRGMVVRLESLVTALRSGTIAGAALDVFEHEPLPPDHPLWKMENVIITPHCAHQSAALEARRNDLMVENARRFLHGEPLLNVVDKQRGYVV